MAKSEIKINTNQLVDNIEERLIKIFNNARTEIKEKIAFGIFCSNFISQRPNDIVELWKTTNKNEKQKFYDIAETILKMDIKELEE